MRARVSIKVSLFVIYFISLRAEFLCVVIGRPHHNIEPEYEEPYPVHYYINFEDPESVERYKRHKEKVKQEGRDESTKLQGQ